MLDLKQILVRDIYKLILNKLSKKESKYKLNLKLKKIKTIILLI